MTVLNIIDDLSARGLVAQATPELAAHLKQARTLYCGFDPTADSLHIGSLVPLLALRRFQQAGHTPIVLVGGATGMIGDPSFKAQERKLNDEDTIKGWVEKLKQQTSRFVDFGGKNPAKMANNYDWTHGVDILRFLRDVGKHFSVNNLIGKEAIKSRLEREDSGISFTEFTYPLLQAFDFQQLFTREECTLQIGGSDQWGNMTAGTELIRKAEKDEAHVLTLPLVTKADGTKFGKTESGTIWLDANKTSPYAFYQFFLNTADADVDAFLKYFSFNDLKEINEVISEHKKAPEKRLAQKTLAEELTTLVHGADALQAAQRISAALFGGELSSLTENDFAQLAQDGLPTLAVRPNGALLPQGLKIESEPITALFEAHYLMNVKISLPDGSHPAMWPHIAEFKGHADILSTLLLTSLAGSKREARDFIKGNAVQVNGQVVADEKLELTRANALFGKYHLLKRGKRNFALLVLE